MVDIIHPSLNKIFQSAVYSMVAKRSVCKHSGRKYVTVALLHQGCGPDGLWQVSQNIFTPAAWKKNSLLIQSKVKGQWFLCHQSLRSMLHKPVGTLYIIFCVDFSPDLKEATEEDESSLGQYAFLHVGLELVPIFFLFWLIFGLNWKRSLELIYVFLHPNHHIMSRPSVEDPDSFLNVAGTALSLPFNANHPH